ncbi:hypothetical protein KBA01_24740 [Kozakia baliensis]|nr:hypothetical protein KBA01_24740 [Kozakia baliensis]
MHLDDTFTRIRVLSELIGPIINKSTSPYNPVTSHYVRLGETVVPHGLFKRQSRSMRRRISGSFADSDEHDDFMIFR